MTTNANKYGLRKAAQERTNRHAQRTPLPPKAGTVQDAKYVINSLTSLQAVVVDGGASGARSLGKARAFAELASTGGWSVSIEARGEAVELTLTRGAETIVQAWLNGVWQYDASIYAYGDRSTKPRNASGAKRLLARSEADASAEMNKVLANNSFRKREPAELATLRPELPFDRETATDEEIIKSVSSHAIVWYNRISRGKESALVGAPKSIRMTYLPTGEKILNWCCPVTGFRSCLVESIIQVGRGRNATTKGSEHAVVEVDS